MQCAASPANLSGKADSGGKPSQGFGYIAAALDSPLPPAVWRLTMSASTDTVPSPLLTTPLNALHIELNARMVPFAGYSMPVQYPMGLMAEHLHTRKAAGLFDVSHMGQLRLVGPDAAAAFETLMPVDVASWRA